ncbi:hypothetical protein QQY24_12915 [Streptomyces sp. TG1A-8]|uniref:hypothetical protein n=1 Tax=Streptomyces sp. TG1A-8 TaxID=3051385 RepID=UPI00265BE505|nr:hypothetical protein [Streptomyces sp. TG1A-8]MDO0926282.1 hypothetical protein [Streptomyces sp. TG1A-8]
MARLSFDKKRARQPAAHPAAVHVRVTGAGGAAVDGTAVVAAPGEEVRQAVLNHLQRLAISLGAPIRAMIHDDRAGCVVPLEVAADGSSRLVGRPTRQPAAEPEPPRRPAATPGPTRWPDAGSPPERVPWPEAGLAPDAGLTPEAARHPVAAPAHAPATGGVPRPGPVPEGAPGPVPEGAPGPVPEGAPAPGSTSAPDLIPVFEPTPASAPAPPRGFDALAEEVLGDEPVTGTAEGAELLTGPMARINEAVRAGRPRAAAELAARTVPDASAVLGARHPDVLHLRELAAYITYLAGDPVRACHLCLDLARLRRQTGDAEAAYGNVQGAATAWRAVRDPEEGLRLGRDLIGLWADLAAQPGPAAGDPRPLESARARMVRLADRAAKAARA